MAEDKRDAAGSGVVRSWMGTADWVAVVCGFCFLVWFLIARRKGKSTTVDLSLNDLKPVTSHLTAFDSAQDTEGFVARMKASVSASFGHV
ncbi:unnamed protein product [Soboliphyme baturini]|uniref:MotB_plug domain-containing protein n=1 Tax=Soboliphyme baturini TaxID=241478 RepID=A0A183J8P8_9BILA|nr:unnamed protein product [Soboliphyme baturini]